MRQATFASGDVNVSWDGVPFEGHAPDSFITVVRNSDVTDEEVGADGQLSVSSLVDKTGTVTLTLQQQSITNNILAAILAGQERDYDVYYGNMVISDPSGGVMVRIENAHIKSTPELDIGNTATGKTRQWTFFAERIAFDEIPGQSALTARVTDFVSAQAEGFISRALSKIL